MPSTGYFSAVPTSELEDYAMSSFAQHYARTGSVDASLAALDAQVPGTSGNVPSLVIQQARQEELRKRFDADEQAIYQQRVAPQIEQRYRAEFDADVARLEQEAAARQERALRAQFDRDVERLPGWNPSPSQGAGFDYGDPSGPAPTMQDAGAINTAWSEYRAPQPQRQAPQEVPTFEASRIPPWEREAPQRPAQASDYRPFGAASPGRRIVEGIGSTLQQAGRAISDAWNGPEPSGAYGSAQGRLDLPGMAGQTLSATSPMGDYAASRPVVEGFGEGAQRTLRPVGEAIGAGNERLGAGDLQGAAAGYLGAAGQGIVGAFNAPGNMTSEAIKNVDPEAEQAAELVGAGVNFAMPWGGASTLANLSRMGRVGQAAIGVLGSTAAIGAGTVAYQAAKQRGASDEDAWLQAAAAAVNGADVGLGVGELGVGLARGAAGLVGQWRAPTLTPEPAAGFVQSGQRSTSPVADADTWSDTTFVQALTDPAKRQTILRAAGGNPTRAEETAGKIGTVAGGVAGASTGPEDQTWQERAARGALGALGGSQVGARFPRLVEAVKGAASEARAADGLGILYGARGEVISDVSAPVARADELARPDGAPLRVPALVQEAARAATKDAPERAGTVEKLLAIGLSNPFSVGTVGLNTAGNVIQTIARPIQEVLEGRPAVAWADLVAMGQASRGAAGRAGKVLVGGRNAVEGDVAQSMMEAAGRPEAFPGRAGLVATPVARVNQALDEFFRGVNTAGATAVARARGMTPEEAAPFIAEAAATSVFQGDPSRLTRFITDMGQKAQANPAANLLWRAGAYAFFPYVRTQEQLAKQAINVFSAPVTQLGRMIRAGAERDPEKFRQAFAKWAMGTAVWGVALDQASRGNLTSVGTGSFQEEALARNARDEQGNPIRQPEAFRVGGRWFPAELAGPWGMAATDIAALVEGWNAPGRQGQPTPDDFERAKNALNTLGRQLSRQFILEDFVRFADAWREGRGVEATGNVLRDQATRLTPGLLNNAAQLTDPVVREPSNAAEAVAARVPGLSGSVPPKIDPSTGAPMTRNQDFLSVVFRSPAHGAPNPVAAEVARLERVGHPVSVKQFPREATYAGEKQTSEQRRTLQEAMGRATALYITEMMNRPDYRGLSDREKAVTLNKALATAYTVADLRLSDAQVARDTKHKALREWAQTPHYQGVTGTPEEIALENLRIAQARAKRSEYRTRYGPEGDSRLYQEDPDALALARRPALNSRYITELRRQIDAKYGGALTRAAKEGLPGAGNEVLDVERAALAPPQFVAPVTAAVAGR